MHPLKSPNMGTILNGGTNSLGYSNFEKNTNLDTPYFVDYDIPT